MKRRSHLLVRLGGGLILGMLTILAVLTLLFILIQVAPGDPVSFRYQSGAALTPEQYEELRGRFGLDRSMLEQYLIYMGNLLQGDLGESSRFNESVWNVVLGAMPATLILMVPAMIIGALLGTYLGTVSARKPDGWIDNSLRATSLLAYSTPPFWLGLLLIQLLVIRFAVFPSVGMVDPRFEPGTLDYLRSIAWHTVLPVLSLSAYFVALFSRYGRTAMLREAGKNYVITARAKGLKPRRVFWRHVFRNGLLPLVTLSGLTFRSLLGGAVFIEVVFSWPGIGLLLFEATLARDFTVIIGVFLLSVVTIVAFNILVDMAYGVVDPRVRGEA